MSNFRETLELSTWLLEIEETKISTKFKFQSILMKANIIDLWYPRSRPNICMKIKFIQIIMMV